MVAGEAGRGVEKPVIYFFRTELLMTFTFLSNELFAVKHDCAYVSFYFFAYLFLYLLFTFLLVTFCRQHIFNLKKNF